MKSPILYDTEAFTGPEPPSWSSDLRLPAYRSSHMLRYHPYAGRRKSLNVCALDAGGVVSLRDQSPTMLEQRNLPARLDEQRRLAISQFLTVWTSLDKLVSAVEDQSMCGPRCGKRLAFIELVIDFALVMRRLWQSRAYVYRHLTPVAPILLSSGSCLLFS